MDIGLRVVDPRTRHFPSSSLNAISLFVLGVEFLFGFGLHHRGVGDVLLQLIGKGLGLLWCHPGR